MERLTVRKEDGKGTCGMPCFTCDAHCGFIDDVFDKLADYEDAEEQGVLLRLPCKVGTIVFVIVEEYEEIYEPSSKYYDIYEEEFHPYMLESMGKDIFLTKEEAEKALAEEGV